MWRYLDKVLKGWGKDALKNKNDGLDGYRWVCRDSETDISNGIPSFDMVGLGDTAVKESKERVRAAIKMPVLSFR